MLTEGVRMDGRELVLSPVLEIPPGRHDLEIDFTYTLSDRKALINVARHSADASNGMRR